MAHSFLHWTLIYSKIPRLMLFTIAGTSIFLFAIVSVGYTGDDVRSRRHPTPHHETQRGHVPRGCKGAAQPLPLSTQHECPAYPSPLKSRLHLRPRPQRLSNTRADNDSIPDAIIWIMVGNLIGAVHYFVRNKALWQHLVLRAQQQRALRTIQKETEKCEQLLANILPPHLIGCLNR